MNISIFEPSISGESVLSFQHSHVFVLVLLLKIMNTLRSHFHIPTVSYDDLFTSWSSYDLSLVY